MERTGMEKGRMARGISYGKGDRLRLLAEINILKYQTSTTLPPLHKCLIYRINARQLPDFTLYHLFQSAFLPN
jgi:hypothetical protein